MTPAKRQRWTGFVAAQLTVLLHVWVGSYFGFLRGSLILLVCDSLMAAGVWYGRSQRAAS